APSTRTCAPTSPTSRRAGEARCSRPRRSRGRARSRTRAMPTTSRGSPETSWTASSTEVTMAETFVLLHGSWHGGWAWEPTAWCLRELGHEVYAPTYPGHQPGASRAGIRHQDYVRW